MRETDDNNHNVKTVLPPPIVIDKTHSLTEIQRILGRDYTYKKTYVSKEKFNKCKEELTQRSYKFHTYRAKDEQIMTVYLYGLPKMDTSEIKAELETNNIAPIDITEVITKHSTVDDAVYKIRFLRNAIKVAHLKNIVSINKVIVTWKLYKPRKTNGEPTPTLCCVMYGHGGENCHRTASCMTCASNQHLSKDCPLLNSTENVPVYKCFNCVKSGRADSNHKANDIRCPSRLKYLRIRSQTTGS